MRGAISRFYAAFRCGEMAQLVCGAAASGLLLSGTSAAAESVQNHVREIRLRAGDAPTRAAIIEIVGTSSPVYHVRTSDAGRRLLIDLDESDLSGAPSSLTVAVGAVGGILTQAYPAASGSTMTRLSVSLKEEATYRVVPDGPTLRVWVEPRAKGDTTAASEITARPAAPTPPATDPITIRDVLFERKSADTEGCAPYGCDRVVIELPAVPPYAVSVSPQDHPRLELRGAILPAKLARTIDVSAFHGALKSITGSQDASRGVAVIEIDRATGVQGTVSVDGGVLAWSFPVPKPNLPPPPVTQVHLDGTSAGEDGGAVRRVVTVARETAPAVGPDIETSIHQGGPIVESTVAGAAGFASDVGLLGQQRYTGRRIDIDLKDADIHNVLRLLADTGHINIVTADEVNGTITIKMKNVPWDQVLDVVLQAKSLGMVRQGNIVRVAPLAQLQKEREYRLAQQKQEFELTPLETRLIPVSYASAEELQARAKELLSPRGSLSVDARTNVIIARDVAGNLNYVEELIRSLDTQTAQVLVEARIVEATSNYTRDVGIQWGGDVTFGPSTGNPTGIAFPNSVSAAGGAYDTSAPTAGLSPFTQQVTVPNFAVNLPAAVGTGSGGALGLTFGSIDNALSLNVRLSAAETSGLVRIVSAPRVLVLDNRDARINQGTLIPYSQVSALGVQTTFQEAKLQLLVRPHVTAEGSVSMHIKVTRDEPDFNQTGANGAPTILKREAETDLLVMDGRTAVIGGIYTRNTGRNLTQVPFFGDIPILGVLFQRRQANDARGELIIFITPHIINRAEALGH
jgi:type IV pilus assembly protein PilQ